MNLWNRHLRLCHRKPGVELVRKPGPNGVCEESSGDPLGHWNLLLWRGFDPSSESLWPLDWGCQIVTWMRSFLNMTMTNVLSLFCKYSIIDLFWRLSSHGFCLCFWCLVLLWCFPLVTSQHHQHKNLGVAPLPIQHPTAPFPGGLSSSAHWRCFQSPGIFQPTKS